MHSEFICPPSWSDCAERILQDPGGTCVVIGPTDVGKTTFVRFLVAHAAERFGACLYVDADIGQSVIGPPGCVGASIITNPQDAWSPVIPADFIQFVGDVSPARHLLQHVVATGAAVRFFSAEEAVCRVVDTTGLVDGSIGFQLKVRKIELLRPTDVVFMGCGPGLASVRKALPPCVRTHDVLPSMARRERSRDERRLRREELFAAYFARSESVTISLPQISIDGCHLEPARAELGINPLPERIEPNTIVSLFEKQGVHKALALVKIHDCENNILHCLSPWRGEFDGVYIGCLRVSLSGEELPRSAPVRLTRSPFRAHTFS